MKYGDIFADVYRKHLIHFSVQVAPRIFKYIANKHTKRKILDVCCGTGELAYYFLNKGYEVAGVDISEDMLYYAKQLNRQFVEEKKAAFHCDDARYFTLNKVFPIIVSTYDALNHLEDDQSLFQCFQNVYRHLEEEGIFIFDLNTRQGLAKGGTFIREDDTLYSVAQGLFDPNKNLAVTRYYGFVKKEGDNVYYKYDQIIYNTVFNMQNVKEYLQEAGFKLVKFAHVYNLLKDVENPELEDRVFIIATK